VGRICLTWVTSAIVLFSRAKNPCNRWVSGEMEGSGQESQEARRAEMGDVRREGGNWGLAREADDQLLHR
jgi:hypothetical protein